MIGRALDRQSYIIMAKLGGATTWTGWGCTATDDKAGSVPSRDWGGNAHRFCIFGNGRALGPGSRALAATLPEMAGRDRNRMGRSATARRLHRHLDGVSDNRLSVWRSSPGCSGNVV